MNDKTKYEIVEENKNKVKNEYRFYIYDWLIGQHLITIDTEKNRSRIDGFNIYGQCYSLGEKWEKITKATIEKAKRRSGYVYDEFITKHFINSDHSLHKELLFKSNDYNECIKYLADYGEKNRNNTIYEGEEYRKRYKGYYKNYLDIPENKIGKILKDGTVKKEYFQEGHIYKNICNFYRQDGICYISEGQADKINKKSKPGEDYETYQTIYNKVKEAYEKAGIDEKKYKLKYFVETIFNDLNWQTVEALTMDSIDALDNEYFLEEEAESI